MNAILIVFVAVSEFVEAVAREQEGRKLFESMVSHLMGLCDESPSVDVLEQWLPVYVAADSEIYRMGFRPCGLLSDLLVKLLVGVKMREEGS